MREKEIKRGRGREREREKEKDKKNGGKVKKKKKRKTLAACMLHLIVQNKRVDCESREFGVERRTRGKSAQVQMIDKTHSAL